MKRTTKVGSYEPNVLGLHDMHGNVWEWCDDEEKNAEGGSFRVFRGGSWDNDAAYCTSVFRDGVTPTNRGTIRGFRLALSSSGIPK